MPQSRSRELPVDADPHKASAGEFEVVVRGLAPLAVRASRDAPPAGAVPLMNVLRDLVQSVADAQLAADVAAAKAVASAANAWVGDIGEEESEDDPWANSAGVLPSFYQIAEVTLDLSVPVHLLPASSPDVTAFSVQVTDPTDGTAGTNPVNAAGTLVRLVLRQVPTPPGVMENLPVRNATIHFD